MGLVILWSANAAASTDILERTVQDAFVPKAKLGAILLLLLTPRTMMPFVPTWVYVILSAARARASRDSQGKHVNAVSVPITVTLMGDA